MRRLAIDATLLWVVLLVAGWLYAAVRGADLKICLAMAGLMAGLDTAALGLVCGRGAKPQAAGERGDEAASRVGGSVTAAMWAMAVRLSLPLAALAWFSRRDVATRWQAEAGALPLLYLIGLAMWAALCWRRLRIDGAGSKPQAWTGR